MAKRFGAPACSRVFISSRSIALIRLGLQQLFKRCRRCLTVDTCWPRYLQELHKASAEKSDSVFVKSYRRPVFDRGVTVDEFCENLCMVYCSEGCNGLFLPAVDHLGTRIPVAQIVRTIREFGGEVRFVVVDAAQALGHIPLDDDCNVADFIVAGTHKWLGSYSTLGIGVAPQTTSSAAIGIGIQQALRNSLTDDGLLAFIEQLKGDANIQSETVNLCPLF
ncbi:MAG: aminotransferase class V-fold PLP-dependent enzyme, partial [Planctomycetales bacterium]|nr:aminotransferase class V-fold PLP-dependent enzyme [Planctomycetales bacterium]